MMDSLCLGREDTTESWWWRWLASARRLSALQLERTEDSGPGGAEQAKLASSSGGKDLSKEDLAIQEANALRAKLGLKPLRM